MMSIPDIGVCFATHYTEVLLGCEVIVLLRLRPSRWFKQQTHDEGILTLQLLSDQNQSHSH